MSSVDPEIWHGPNFAQPDSDEGVVHADSFASSSPDHIPPGIRAQSALARVDVA